MEGVIGLGGIFLFFAVGSTILVVLIHWIMKETKYLNKD